MAYLIALLLSLTLPPVPPLTLQLNSTIFFEANHIPVEYRIHITPHKDNIYYVVGWINCPLLSNDEPDCKADPPLAERASWKPISQYTPSSFTEDWKDLEPGEYLAFVELFRAPDYRVARDELRFKVLEK